MRTKFSLIVGGMLTMGLVLTHQSFAQTNFLQVSRNETSKPVQSNDKLAADVIAPSQTIPLVAPQVMDWEKRFGAIANQEPSVQSESLEELAATFSEDQIIAALNKLVAEPSDPARILVTFLARRWAATSPADAAQWVVRHLTGDIFGRNVLSKVMVSWARKDLAGAVAWIQKVPTDGHKAAAALALVTEAARLGKAVIAINLATNLPPGSERDELFSYSAQQWAATDKDSAVAWIKKNPDTTLRQKILGKVAINLGALDPAAGTRFVATEMSDDKDRDNAMSNVIRFWAASAPADAAAWMRQFPEGALHDLALENLMDTWGKENSTEASQWLNQLPAGHSRDIAANALAHSAK